MNFKKIDNLLRLKQIQRLPNVPHLRGYNILEHGFVVGMLFRWFASQEDVAYSIDHLDRVLMHDYVEATTGDLNYVVKNHSAETKAAWNTIEKAICDADTTLKHYSDAAIKELFNDRQFRLFKVCDYLDLWIFCKQEEALGNHTQAMQGVIENCRSLIWELTNNGNEFKSVFEFMAQFKA